MALKFKRHPGRDYVKVICDVCGGLFYQKDVTQVNDKYNFQHGLVVCRKDLDQINEQVLPNRHVDLPISQPEILRPERADQFAVNANDDRVPGPPRVPYAQVNPINDTIDLFWQGPEDNGSSPIIGYKIARADPQLGFYDIIESNSRTEYPYYQDLTADVSIDYSYKVAAINSFGTGPYSVEFFWPTFTDTWQDIIYLEVNGSVLNVNGSNLRMNHTEVGTL